LTPIVAREDVQSGDTAPCERLDWDSDFFGMPIARFAAPVVDEETLLQADTWCHAREIRCLYLLLTPDNAHEIGTVKKAGYRSVATRVELFADCGQSRASLGSGRSSDVRAAVRSDLPALRAIAGHSHHASRFYADGGFSEAKCNLLFETWIQRSFDSQTERVDVVTTEGVPVGYVAYGPDALGASGQIGLIAIAESYRGRGLGSALVCRVLEWVDSEQVSGLSVVTQATNLAALRLYRQHAFETTSVAEWFHKWFPEPTSGPTPPRRAVI
jgi:ribosomal protein S18 acetylase RimI-like enzyme